MEGRILQYYKTMDKGKNSCHEYVCCARALHAQSLSSSTCMPKHIHAPKNISLPKSACTPKQAYVLDIKAKTLLQLALADILHCPDCTKIHMKKALALGATRQELTEAIFLACSDKAFSKKI